MTVHIDRENVLKITARMDSIEKEERQHARNLGRDDGEQWAAADASRRALDRLLDRATLTWQVLNDEFGLTLEALGHEGFDPDEENLAVYYEAEYLEGFAEGAMEVWKAIKAKPSE